MLGISTFINAGQIFSVQNCLWVKVGIKWPLIRNDYTRNDRQSFFKIIVDFITKNFMHVFTQLSSRVREKGISFWYIDPFIFELVCLLASVIFSHMQMLSDDFAADVL